MQVYNLAPDVPSVLLKKSELSLQFGNISSMTHLVVEESIFLLTGHDGKVIESLKIKMEK